MPIDERDKLSLRRVLSWAEEPELEEIEALIAERRRDALRAPCVWSGVVDGLRVRILRADEHTLIVYQRTPEPEAPEGTPVLGQHPSFSLEEHGWTAADDAVASRAFEAALVSKLLPGEGLRQGPVPREDPRIPREDPQHT